MATQLSPTWNAIQVGPAKSENPRASQRVASAAQPADGLNHWKRLAKHGKNNLGSSEHLGEHTKIPWSIIKYDRYPHSVAIIGSIIFPHSKTDPLQNQWQSVLQQLVRTQQPAWPRSLAPGIKKKKR